MARQPACRELVMVAPPLHHAIKTFRRFIGSRMASDELAIGGQNDGPITVGRGHDALNRKGLSKWTRQISERCRCCQRPQCC